MACERCFSFRRSFSPAAHDVTASNFSHNLRPPSVTSVASVRCFYPVALILAQNSWCSLDHERIKFGCAQPVQQMLDSFGDNGLERSAFNFAFE